jgi:predicted MPP superfamily phosphohydrolase
MATTGYLWMAWIFLAMTMFLASDVLYLALSGADAIFRTRCAARVLSPQARVGVVAAASLLLAGYGVFEAQSLRVTPVVVVGSPAMRTPRFRIAHVSDVHLGPVSPWRLLERIEAALDAAAPDLVVFTGDLVDGRMDGRAEDRAILSRIASRFPTLAVTGNHEMIAGLGQAVEFLRSAGVAVLRNRTVAPEPWLYVAGVDDPATGAYDETTERRLLDASDGAFAVLLKHRSGHTHGGQIFPFSLLVNRVNGLTAGIHRLAGRGVVAVSRGAGTWGPPVRLLAPPEILIVDIVRP